MRYFLSLSTYVGLTFGASHYYASIKSEDYEIPTVELKIDQATGYTDPDDPDVPLMYETARLPNRETAITLACAWFEKNGKPDDVLIVGSTAIADPQEILCAAPEIKKAANALWRRTVKIGQWDVRAKWPQMEALSAKWEAIVPTAPPKPAPPVRRRPPRPDGD